MGVTQNSSSHNYS